MSPAKNKRAARDLDATVHLHVRPGRTVVLADGCSYGDRATLQVPGRMAEELLAAGNVEEIDPAAVPDVAERLGGARQEYVVRLGCYVRAFRRS